VLAVDGGGLINFWLYSPTPFRNSEAIEKLPILPKILPMCLTRDDLILSYGEFFHITSREAADRILIEGLLPQQADSITAGSRPLICVAPQEQSNRWRDQISKDLVIFRIAAADIISNEYGIDHTFFGWKAAEVMGDIEGLRHMIEENATLAVFDRIPPEELTVVEGM
jgi:hypothetical protein